MPDSEHQLTEKLKKNDCLSVSEQSVDDSAVSRGVENGRCKDTDTLGYIPLNTKGDMHLEAEQSISPGRNQSCHVEFDGEDKESDFITSLTGLDKDVEQVKAMHLILKDDNSSVLNRPQSPENPSKVNGFVFSKHCPTPVNYTGTRKGPAANSFRVPSCFTITDRFVVPAKNDTQQDFVQPQRSRDATILDETVSVHQASTQNSFRADRFSPHDQDDRKRRRKRHKMRNKTHQDKTFSTKADGMLSVNVTSSAGLEIANTVDNQYGAISLKEGQAKLEKPSSELAKDFDVMQNNSEAMVLPDFPTQSFLQSTNSLNPISALSLALPQSGLHYPDNESHSQHTYVRENVGATTSELVGVPLAKSDGSPVQHTLSHCDADAAQPSQRPFSDMYHVQSCLHPTEQEKSRESVVEDDSAPFPKLQGSLHESAQVRRRGSKPTLRDVASVQPDGSNNSETSSDVDDYAQILAYKVKEKKRLASARFIAERQALHTELRKVLKLKNDLQERIGVALQNNGDLTAELARQKDQTKHCEMKFKRLKTFVDGLGNDMNALKMETCATRRKHESLTQDIGDHKAEQKALCDKVSCWSEKSSHLQGQALKFCHDAQSELQNVRLRNEYLEKEMSEKAGLLSEERDRRAQLETQLADARAFEKNIWQAMKAESSAVVDKLCQIQSSIDEAEATQTTAEMFDKTLSAVHALNSQQDVNTNDLRSVMNLVESFSKSIENFAETHDASGKNVALAMTSIQASLDHTLSDLKVHQDQRETLLLQDAIHCETIITLNEKLKAMTVCCTETKTELSNLQADKTQLEEKNTSLHMEVITLQENNQTQLKEVISELGEKTKLCESSQAELHANTEELRVLRTRNEDLNDQIRILEDRVSEADHLAYDNEPVVADLKRMHEAELESLKAEMTKNANEFHAQESSKRDNELRKLTTQHENLQRTVQQLTNELALSDGQFRRLQKEKSDSILESSREMVELELQAQSWKQEVETLRGSLEKLESSPSAIEKHDTLLAQLSAEKVKLQHCVGAKDSLLEQLKALQCTSAEAQAAEEQLRAELGRNREENRTKQESLQRKLQESEELAKRQSEGVASLNKEHDEALKKEEQKRDKQVRALQNRLAEAQGELQARVTEHEQFCSDLHVSWKQEQKGFEEKTARLRHEVVEAQMQRDKAVAENERCQRKSELDSERKVSKAIQVAEQLISHDALQTGKGLTEPALQRRLSSQSSSCSRVRAQDLEEASPSATSGKGNRPPKNQTKDICNSNTVVEVAQLKFTEDPRFANLDALSQGVLSQASMHVESQLNCHENTVIEESQPLAIEDSFWQDLMAAPAGNSNLNELNMDPEDKTVGLSCNSDEMLEVHVFRSERASSVVQDTQMTTHLPSFAAFNKDMASQANTLCGASSSGLSSIPSTFSTPMPSDVRHALRDGLDMQETSQPGPGVPQTQVVEGWRDTLDASKALDRDAARNHSQTPDGVLSSQKTERYTYQRSFPQPNSGSKLTYHDSDNTTSHQLGQPMVGRNESSHDKPRVYTPELRSQDRDISEKEAYPLQTGKPASQQSSSPDFVSRKDAATKHDVITYRPSGEAGGATRRVVRTNPGKASDPRLVGREQPPTPKRRTDEDFVEDHEEKRRKQPSKRFGASSGDIGRYSLRTSASVDTLTHASARASGSSDTHPKSRARVSTGITKRNTRSAKNAKFSARFSAELLGR